MVANEPRITVSEDKIRALFAEFKLDLLAELKDYVSLVAFQALESRVKTLELWQASVIGGVAERRRFSSATLAWAAVAVAALGALATIVALHGAL